MTFTFLRLSGTSSLTLLGHKGKNDRSGSSSYRHRKFLRREGEGQKRQTPTGQDVARPQPTVLYLSGLSKDQQLPKGQGPETKGDTTGKVGASPAKAPSPQHLSRTGMVTRVKPESRSSDKLVAMKQGQCKAGKSIAGQDQIQ